MLSGQKYEADVAKLFVQKLDLNNEDVLQTLSNLQSSDNIDEMKKAVATADILLPPSISVARKMITAWYVAKDGYTVADLTGGETWR